MVSENVVRGYSNSQLAAARNIGNSQLVTSVRLVPVEYPCLVLTLWRAANQCTYTYEAFIDTIDNQNLDAYIYRIWTSMMNKV